MSTFTSTSSTKRLHYLEIPDFLYKVGRIKEETANVLIDRLAYKKSRSITMNYLKGMLGVKLSKQPDGSFVVTVESYYNKHNKPSQPYKSIW